jgi:hypothetical protein
MYKATNNDKETGHKIFTQATFSKLAIDIICSEKAQMNKKSHEEIYRHNF